MSDFIYRRSGDVYTPSEWAGSPWSRELQHGGPVCGLVARAAEAVAQETGLRVVRLTVDLCRPTPLEPLALVCETARRGRRLALLDVRLRRGDQDVTRASALLLAPSAEAPSAGPPPEPAPPGPDGIAPVQLMPREYAAQVPPGFHRSIEVRLSEDELGPALWVTTPLALVSGEATSPLVRAAMLSDLTYGLSGHLLLRRRRELPAAGRAALINADVTLYLERPPDGAWVAMRSASLRELAGIGVAEVVQLDRAGRFGRSLQALV